MQLAEKRSDERLLLLVCAAKFQNRRAHLLCGVLDILHGLTRTRASGLVAAFSLADVFFAFQDDLLQTFIRVQGVPFEGVLFESIGAGRSGEWGGDSGQSRAVQTGCYTHKWGYSAHSVTLAHGGKQALKQLKGGMHVLGMALMHEKRGHARGH